MDPRYAFLFGEVLFKPKSEQDVQEILAPHLRLLTSGSGCQVEVLKLLGLIAIGRLELGLSLSRGRHSGLVVRTISDVHGLLVASIVDGSPEREALVLTRDGRVEAACLSSRMRKRLANIAALSEPDTVKEDHGQDFYLPGVCTWNGTEYVPDDAHYGLV